MPGPPSRPWAGLASEALLMSCTSRDSRSGDREVPLPERLVLGCAWESEAGKTTEASLGVPCVQGCGRDSSKQALVQSPDSPTAWLNQTERDGHCSLEDKGGMGLGGEAGGGGS